MSEIQDVLSERGKRYGAFRDHAQLTQRLKKVMRDGRNWPFLPAYQKEALEMIAHKIGRLLNGDWTYEDNLVDILGYGQLALDDLRADNQRRIGFQDV